MVEKEKNAVENPFSKNTVENIRRSSTPPVHVENLPAQGVRRSFHNFSPFCFYF